MDEETFKAYASQAKVLGNYGAGYLRGLRRHYHGERFGTAEEHAKWLSLGDSDQQLDEGKGYCDGFAGTAPKRRPGRPTTLGTKPRRITLDDDRAEFAQMLGDGNLSKGIRRALDIARGVMEEKDTSIEDTIGDRP